MRENKELLSLLNKQDYYLNRIYNSLSIELSKILIRYKVNSNSKVWFKNQKVRREVDEVLTKYRKLIFNQISETVKQSWDLSNKSNDNLVNAYVKGLTIPNIEKLYQSNLGSLKAFLKRQDNGIDLSNRVWRITNTTRSQIEYFLAEGLSSGRSAVQLSKDLKRYLKHPDKRFRRIKDKQTGKLKLSEPSKNFKPGRGIFKSSFKNALRLARNEISIAYRTADYERRKQLPFVTGISVNLSSAHPRYDICDELVGDYPKNFVFTGWHPNCLCYTTAKLLSKEDFIDQLNGKKIGPEKYQKEIPKKAEKYLNENLEKLKKLKSVPYFLKDNFDIDKSTIRLKKNSTEQVI